jgi:hypothetical protein
MNFRHLFLISFVFFSNYCYSQTKTADSLEKVLKTVKLLPNKRAAILDEYALLIATAKDTVKINVVANNMLTLSTLLKKFLNP